MNIPRQLALSFCLALSLPSLIFAAEQRPNILLVVRPQAAPTLSN